MINEMSALRLQVLSKVRGYKDSDGIGTVIQNYFKALETYREGEPFTLYKDGTLIAHVFKSRFYHRFYGNVLTQYVVDYDLRFEDEAIKFICEKLDGEALSDDFRLIEVFSPCYKLKTTLEENWRVAATSYGGDPSISLPKAADRSENLSLKNLEFVEAQSLEELEEVMSIKMAAFRKEPDLCWYWKCDQYQTQEFMRLVNSLSRSETFLVKEGQRVVGYGGLSVEKKNPYWGTTSGIDIALVDEFRGQGLSYSIYQFLLEKMVDRGVEFYKGATANPGVIKVSQYLERWPIFYQLLPKGFRVR